MSLDVHLMKLKPTSVFDWNITHNLGGMAKEVEFADGLNLYQILWRPDEHELTTACQILSYLEEGYVRLLSNPEKFKQLNPPNGWGSYEGLLDFVSAYLDACTQDPGATIRVSR